MVWRLPPARPGLKHPRFGLVRCQTSYRERLNRRGPGCVSQIATERAWRALPGTEVRHCGTDGAAAHGGAATRRTAVPWVVSPTALGPLWGDSEPHRRPPCTDPVLPAAPRRAVMSAWR